jgi:hypothetical protein
MACALMIPAMAVSAFGAAHKEDSYPVGTKIWINVNFHCGNENGGPDQFKAMQLEDVTGWMTRDLLDLTDYVGTPSTVGWEKHSLHVPQFDLLIEKVDALHWQLVDDVFVCPNCGKTEWFSYSNMDGLADGAEINVTHHLDHYTKIDPDPVSAEVSIDISKTFVNEVHKPVYKRIGSDDTVIIGKTIRNGVDVRTPLVGANKNRQHFGYIPILAEEGTISLAVGDKLTPINVDVNYKIVNGELKLWFDPAKYANISTKGVIAVVSNIKDKNGFVGIDENAMNPGHATIGIGESNAATALKWFSPNGDPLHKKKVTWHTGNVAPGDLLFLHFEGLKVDDLSSQPVCQVIGTEVAAGFEDYNIKVLDAAGAVVSEGKFSSTRFFTPEIITDGTFTYGYTVVLEIKGAQVAAIPVTFTIVVTQDGTGALHLEKTSLDYLDYAQVDFGQFVVGVNCPVCNP